MKKTFRFLFNAFLSMSFVLTFICHAQDVDANAVSSNDGTALVKAAVEGRVENVKTLIAANNDNDLAKRHYGNALMGAARQGHAEIVALLIAAGADVNTRSPVPPTKAPPKHGAMTSLMMAAQAGHVEVVKQLLAAGADFNAKDISQKNARDYAADESLSPPRPPIPPPPQDVIVREYLETLKKNKESIVNLLDAAIAGAEKKSE